MASMWPPKKNTAFTLYYTLYKNDGTVIANPGTYTKKVSIDGAAIADIAASVTEEDTTYGQLSVVLANTEMNGDAIWVQIKDDTTGCVPFTTTLYTAAATLDELKTETAAILADTGTDGVLISTGTGAKQINVSSGKVPATIAAGDLANDSITAAVIANSAIDSATFASGAITATAIAANAITSSQIANDAITADKIAASAIDFATFAADCKTGSGLKANVESVSANAITATAINTGAITNAKFAAGAIDAAAIANAAIDIATFAADCLTSGALKANVESVSNGAITAAAIATGAIDADALAADASQELIEALFTYNATADYASAAAGSLVKEIADNAGGTSLTLSDIADAVWDETLTAHVTADSAAVAVKDVLTDTGTTLDGLVDAIKAKTDSLTFTVAGDVDVNVQSWLGSAAEAPLADTDIAGAVWDLATSGHTTAGTFGEQVKTDVDAILADTGTDGVVLGADAITAAKIADDAFSSEHFATGALTADALAADAGTEIAAAVGALAVEGSVTLKQLLQVIGAALAGDVTGAGTTEVTIKNAGINGATTRIVATVDADGNRDITTFTVS